MIETPRTDMQREMLQNCGTITKGVTCTRLQEGKKKQKKYLGVILSEKLPKLVADIVRDPRISEDTKQDKCKKNLHLTSHTAGNQTRSQY